MPEGRADMQNDEASDSPTGVGVDVPGRRAQTFVVGWGENAGHRYQSENGHVSVEVVPDDETADAQDDQKHIK